MFQKEKCRFYMEDENGKLVAEVTFPETEPGVFTINRTYVDPSLRGE